MSGIDLEDLKERLGITIYPLDSWYFGDDLAKETLLLHFKIHTLEGLGLADYDCGVVASGALLKYLYETQKNTLSNILAIHPYSIGKYMIIDSSSRRNLELVETLREKQKRGSLLWVLDNIYVPGEEGIADKDAFLGKIQFLAYPSLTLTISPFFPRAFTSSNKITFMLYISLCNHFINDFF